MTNEGTTMESDDTGSPKRTYFAGYPKNTEKTRHDYVKELMAYFLAVQHGAPEDSERETALLAEYPKFFQPSGPAPGQ